jgi:NAD(P)-dependent dehydrogenase (short-subunit alcohol dehydrogenase family)
MADAHGRFRGRVVLVTGAARGIGRAIALKMGNEGASLILMDIDGQKVRELANLLESEGVPSSAFRVDVGEERAVEDAVKEAIGRFGRLDVVVNNAGLVRPASFEGVVEDDWDAVMRVNLKGIFFCVRHALPHMKKQRYGKIVNIGSRAALGKADRTVYSTTKAGIIGLTRTLALELAPHNINVNNVAPGPIATELFTAANPPGSPKTEAILKNIPLGRIGQPEDIADAVAFLASDEAGFITGQTLFVCGGLTIGGVHF